jgi:hypothetical protein
LARIAEREAAKRVQMAELAEQTARTAELLLQTQRETEKVEALMAVEKAGGEAMLEAERKAARDARYDVSSIPPLIPYGGFSPVRLEGWLSDGTFPDVTALKSAPDIHVATPGLHPSFVHFVATSVARPESGRRPDRAPP